jgi:acyl CoA:acetate/3-ketoacid CoA transferase beta subunit
VVTELGVMDVTAQGLLVRELAPGVTRDAFSAACAAAHRFADDLRDVEV